jgi:VanZ family protein
VLACVASVLVLFAPSGGAAPSVPGLDKAVHLALFAFLAGTTRWRFGADLRPLGAVAGYALASEVLQGALLRDRSGDPYDVVADVLGAVLGWVVAQQLLRAAAS